MHHTHTTAIDVFVLWLWYGTITKSFLQKISQNNRARYDVRGVCVWENQISSLLIGTSRIYAKEKR